MFFDTHFHLNDPHYSLDQRDQIIKDTFAQGVGGLINVCADLGEAKQVVEMSLNYKNVFVAIGVHPSQVAKMGPDHFAQLEKLLEKYPDKIVAIGEIGLDYFYQDNPDSQIQEHFFEKQIKLALKYNLPIIVHSRAAAPETINLLEKYSTVKKIIHCFTYDKAIMEKFVKLGCYISFSGIVTFKKAKPIQEAAQHVPLNRLLCETDGPYLTPVPFRGKTNYPYFVKFVYQKIKQLRNENIRDQVLKNVKEVFKITLE